MGDLKILSNAKLLYTQKCEDDLTARYVKLALPYKKLECYCLQYQKIRRKSSDILYKIKVGIHCMKKELKKV